MMMGATFPKKKSVMPRSAWLIAGRSGLNCDSAVVSRGDSDLANFCKMLAKPLATNGVGELVCRACKRVTGFAN